MLPLRIALALLVALPAVAAANSKTFTAELPSGEGGASYTVRPAGTAAFAVSLRVPVGVRVRLSLAGRGAPKGVLIDTARSGCPRSGAVRVCRASYEPLGKGTYTWRLSKLGGSAAKLRLVIRW